MVCNEALRDGALQSWEAKVLQALAQFLGISAPKAEAAARDARRRFQAGRLGEARPFNPQSLYQKVLYHSAVDGRVSRDEGAMLEALRKLFRVDEATHQRLQLQLAAHFRRQGQAPAPGNSDGVVAPPASPASPASASKPTQAPSHPLIDSTRALVRLAHAGETRAEQLAAQAEELMKDLAAPGLPASFPRLAISAELAPLLAAGLRSKAITAYLADLLPTSELWGPERPHLGRTFTGWAHAVTARDDVDEAEGLAETLWGLVHLAPDSSIPWEAWAAGMAELLRGLATRRRWTAHLIQMRRFDQVPAEAAEAVAPAWASAGADWVVLGLHAGAEYCIDRGFHELKFVASFRDQEGVRRSEAAALACVIEVACDDEEGAPRHFLGAVQQLVELSQGYPQDPHIARHLTALSLDAGRALLARDELDRCGELLEAVAAAAPSLPASPALIEEAARAAARLALLRSRTCADPDDRVLVAASAALEALKSHSPSSAGIAEAARRLGQIRGSLVG